MTLRIGIVGTGHTVGIAASHAAAILQDGRAGITAVYNRNQDRGREFIQVFSPAAKICGSYQDLLDSVDAVVVCTPNGSHAHYGAAALKAGKALLLEKPMGINLEESRRMLHEQKATAAFAMMGYVYRYSPAAQCLKRLAREEMGRIYTISATFGGTRLADPAVPLEWRMEHSKSGHGALADFGSHLLDLARFTCGFSPRTLSCHTQTAIPVRSSEPKGVGQVENDDSAVMAGIGGNGELFSLLTSRIGLDGIHLCISGEGGLVRADFAKGSLEYLPKSLGGPYGEKWAALPIAKSEPKDWFASQMGDFLDGIEGKQVPVCSLEEGLEVEEAIFRAGQDAWNIRWEPRANS